MYTARKQQCPNRAPKGLALTTREGVLTASLGTNVTFLVHLDEVGTEPRWLPLEHFRQEMDASHRRGIMNDMDFCFNASRHTG